MNRTSRAACSWIPCLFTEYTYTRNCLSLFLLLLPSILKAQDSSLYNQQNAHKYAGFLSLSGRHAECVSELERLNLLYPGNDQTQAFLIREYRLSGATDQALHFFESHRLTGEQTASEMVTSLILAGKPTEANRVLQNTREILPPERLTYLRSLNLFYERRFKEADLELQSMGAEKKSAEPALSLSKALDDARKTNWKKPGTAALLAAIVPGTGKMYAGYWKDGIISLLFTGSTFYQAYRGFALHGNKSARGWIFSGICLGFYSGNIYGAIRSAKQKNQKNLFRLSEHLGSSPASAF